MAAPLFHQQLRSGGDQPHGISGTATTFVRQVTANVLRAFAQGPAADKYKARDNLAGIGEPHGSLVSPGNTQ